MTKSAAARKSETRMTKSETNPKSERGKSETGANLVAHQSRKVEVCVFGISSSDFVIRISDFQRTSKIKRGRA